MTEYRKPTPAEIEALTAAGNSAENWDAIEVAQDFTPAQLSGCRLEGRVQIGRGARLRRCTIRNYRIGVSYFPRRTVNVGHIKEMEPKVCKLVLSIFIVYCNEIGNVLDVVVYILFIGRINRKIVQYFLQIWYLGIINYIRHFTHPRLPLYGFQFLR